MLVMEVRECNRANAGQPGEAAGQGVQHTGAGWPVLSTFLFRLRKSLLLPEQAQEATLPDVSAWAPPRRPRALLLYLLQLL